MKCPYCDDSIHPMAKFCPKCGLPLKDDQTVQGSYGSYLVDDSGPNPWVIAGGALGIVLVALAIGWMSGQGRRGGDTTVVRQPVSMPFRQGTGMTGLPQTSPLSQTAWGSGSYRPSSSSSVKWAYNPPPAPPRPVVQQAQMNPLLVPMLPPPNMGIVEAFVRQPEVVTSVQTVSEVVPVPAMPAMPPPLPATVATGTFSSPAATSPTAVTPSQLDLGAPPMAGFENPRSGWVYDPVHEQWVIRGDRAPRETGSLNRVPQQTGVLNRGARANTFFGAQ